jgi:Zn-finger nucleic acid-binding protein
MFYILCPICNTTIQEGNPADFQLRYECPLCRFDLSSNKCSNIDSAVGLRFDRIDCLLCGADSEFFICGYDISVREGY